MTATIRLPESRISILALAAGVAFITLGCSSKGSEPTTSPDRRVLDEKAAELEASTSVSFKSQIQQIESQSQTLKSEGTQLRVEIEKFYERYPRIAIQWADPKSLSDDELTTVVENLEREMAWTQSTNLNSTSLIDRIYIERATLSELIKTRKNQCKMALTTEQLKGVSDADYFSEKYKAICLERAGTMDLKVNSATVNWNATVEESRLADAAGKFRAYRLELTNKFYELKRILKSRSSN